MIRCDAIFFFWEPKQVFPLTINRDVLSNQIQDTNCEIIHYGILIYRTRHANSDQGWATLLQSLGLHWILEEIKLEASRALNWFIWPPHIDRSKFSITPPVVLLMHQSPELCPMWQCPCQLQVCNSGTMNTRNKLCLNWSGGFDNTDRCGTSILPRWAFSLIQKSLWA